MSLFRHRPPKSGPCHCSIADYLHDNFHRRKTLYSPAPTLEIIDSGVPAALSPTECDNNPGAIKIEPEQESAVVTSMSTHTKHRTYQLDVDGLQLDYSFVRKREKPRSRWSPTTSRISQTQIPSRHLIPQSAVFGKNVLPAPSSAPSPSSDTALPNASASTIEMPSPSRVSAFKPPRHLMTNSEIEAFERLHGRQLTVEDFFCSDGYYDEDDDDTDTDPI